MPNRFIPKLDGLPPKAALELKNLFSQFYDLNETLQSLAKTTQAKLSQITPSTSGTKAPSLSLGPVAANVTPFLNPQIAKAVSVAALPNVSNDPLSQDGTLISFNGVIYRFDGISTIPGSWKQLGAVAVTIRDTHAARAGYAAASYASGTLYYETDRTVFYESNGANWIYATGRYVDVIANRPADLGANDTGFQFFATDTAEYFRWTGAAWVDGDLQISGDYIWLSGTTFKGTLAHNNSGNRVYTFTDADGNIVYATAALTANHFLLGGGGALASDSGFSTVPASIGGTGVDNSTQTYTPVITNVVNIDATTAYVWQYSRVGNVVEVSGEVDIDPTAAGVATKILLTLPVASAFASLTQCAGVACDPNNAGAVAALLADVASGKVLMSFISTTAANEAWFLNFRYLVV